MSEQTALDEPIKISLAMDTQARSRLNREARIHRADGVNPSDWAAFRAVGSQRQKTNVVLKTLEETASLLRFIYLANPGSRNSRKALDRVEDEVRDELKRRGLAVDDSDRYHPEVVEIDRAGGPVPDDPPFEPGDILQVPGSALGYQHKVDGELVPSESLKDVTVDTLGSEQVLVAHGISQDRLAWIPYSAVEGMNQERMERREISQFVRERREQADWDALAELCQHHCEQVASEVWPGGTVPVADITFEFNPQFSWLGGRYWPRRSAKGPKVELSKKMYVSRGLDYLLSVARHELIHAWQDYHPDGHPSDTHKHHGRDFHQWVDELETHRYCNY